LKPKKEEIS